MSILIDENTKLAVAGITGREGSFHTLNNRRYGTNVVGGINPKKAGENVEGIPVFADWQTTVAETGANAAMIFVPCKDGISHNEIEDAKPEHLEAGCNVLLHAMLERAGVA